MFLSFCLLMFASLRKRLKSARKTCKHPRSQIWTLDKPLQCFTTPPSITSNYSHIFACICLQSMNTSVANVHGKSARMQMLQTSNLGGRLGGFTFCDMMIWLRWGQRNCTNITVILRKLLNFGEIVNRPQKISWWICAHRRNWRPQTLRGTLSPGD